MQRAIRYHTSLFRKSHSIMIIRLIIVSFVILFASQVHAQNPVTRTEQEIKDLIVQEGKKQPVWWNEVKVDYPTTLNLDFPGSVPDSGWDNQRNVGQFVWDIVNPNPHRWRPGIKLFHTLLQRHKDDVNKRNQIMRDMGSMYFRFEQDYARAAFWWKNSGNLQNFSGMAAQLAECYWRLGNKQMALDELEKQPVYLSQIKLLGDMGETDKALKYCESLSKSNPLIANFYAGDACRIVGRNKEALEYYRKATTAPRVDHAKTETFRTRAEANILGLRAFVMLDLKNVADGTYRSDSMGYEAPIHVEVTVKSGVITDVKVTDHREKQFYSSITATCRQIKEKQGVNGVDATSGATMTSEAILNATAKALAGAMN